MPKRKMIAGQVLKILLNVSVIKGLCFFSLTPEEQIATKGMMEEKNPINYHLKGNDISITDVLVRHGLLFFFCFGFFVAVVVGIFYIEFIFDHSPHSH